MAEWLMRRIANPNCVGSIPIRFSKEICRGVRRFGTCTVSSRRSILVVERYACNEK